MKKCLVLAVVLMMSLSANAMDKGKLTEEWQLNNNGFPVVVGKDFSIGAMISGNQIKFSSMNKCTSDMQEGYGIWVINGKAVNMVFECRNLQHIIDISPLNKAGSDYIMNEFKTKNVVIVNGVEISTKSFSKMLDAAQAMEDNAL